MESLKQELFTSHFLCILVRSAKRIWALLKLELMKLMSTTLCKTQRPGRQVVRCSTLFPSKSLTKTADAQFSILRRAITSLIVNTKSKLLQL